MARKATATVSKASKASGNVAKSTTATVSKKGRNMATATTPKSAKKATANGKASKGVHTTKVVKKKLPTTPAVERGHRAEHGVTLVQGKILLALARAKRELSYREIADSANVSYSPLTSIMAASGREQSHDTSLESLGLVVKKASPDGMRSPFVWGLSKKGQALAAKLGK